MKRKPKRPPGRPKLPAAERRRSLTIRVRPDVRIAIERAAKQAGESVTAWLESAARAALERQ